ncbi:MAG: hypothetical protein ACK5LT_14050 [Lachnospirales bacterium]
MVVVSTIFITLIIYGVFIFNRCIYFENKIKILFKETESIMEKNFLVNKDILKDIKYYLPRERDVINNLVNIVHIFRKITETSEKVNRVLEMNYILNYLFTSSFLNFENDFDFKRKKDEFVYIEEKLNIAINLHNQRVENYMVYKKRFYVLPIILIFKFKEFKNLG